LELTERAATTLPVFIAAITKQVPEVPLTAGQFAAGAAVGGLLLILGGWVFRGIIRGVSREGGRVRGDLLGLPDVLVAVALAAMFALLLLLNWVSPEGAAAPPAGGGSAVREMKGSDIIYGALQFALPVAAILALLIGRDIPLADVFGLKRVRLVRAVLLAGGMVLVVLPLIVLVSAIAYELLGKHAQQQDIVKVYQHATKTGKGDLVWPITIAAICIAPVTEELLFRGYIYPVFKRLLGPLPAALGVSVLFAAIHDNALGFPGLTLLALALTLLYERTGSILVPIFMHAWFNSVTLFVMWWAVTHDLMK
jgi:membrane protease YdiL (CAAX protease family)